MESPSSSSLLCHESDVNCLAEDELREQEEEEDEDPFLAAFNGFSDSEEDYVELLLQRERADSSVLADNQTLSFSPPSVLFQGKLTKLARLDAVDYILHTKSQLGFQFETAYLAVAYLDRFLSLRTLDNEKAWASELLSLGCVSLAAKLQECNVSGLSSYQLGNFRFEVKAIQRMELLILSTLEWKMSSITPFNFSPYFINKLFCGPPPATTLTRILQLILAIMKDITLVDHYPSSIALAAVLMSLDESLTTNALYLKINALPCIRFLDIDDVSVCYIIMQKLDGKQTKIMNLLASPNLQPFQLISAKRRRLSFKDGVVKDQSESGRESDI
ncbi:hypothetical protein V2J09_007118 [Rumex salicifolius]